MDSEGPEPFRAKLGRWSRALRAGLEKAKEVAPTAFPVAGAALGFVFSVGTGSWLIILAATVFGGLLGIALLLILYFLAEFWVMILIEVFLVVAGVVVVISVIRALLGI